MIPLETHPRYFTFFLIQRKTSHLEFNIQFLDYFLHYIFSQAVSKVIRSSWCIKKCSVLPVGEWFVCGEERKTHINMSPFSSDFRHILITSSAVTRGWTQVKYLTMVVPNHHNDIIGSLSHTHRFVYVVTGEPQHTYRHTNAHSHREEHAQTCRLPTCTQSWGKSEREQQSLTRGEEERLQENKRMSAEWEAGWGWRGQRRKRWNEKTAAALLLNRLRVFRKTKHKHEIRWKYGNQCLFFFSAFTIFSYCTSHHLLHVRLHPLDFLS